MEIVQVKMESKIGTLYLVASEKGLKKVLWEKQNVPFQDMGGRASEILHQSEKEITEYLEGSRKQFEVELDPDGTDFQKKVWACLITIPYGETRSYKDIATQLNDPNASRAVGTANGKNPICILIPCHRVISFDGSLGGYSAGLDRKKQLLTLEKN